MKRSNDRILTTHAGSLIRTPAIIEAMIATENGETVSLSLGPVQKSA